MKKLLRPIVFIAIVIALFLSRYGWHLTKSNFSSFTNEDKDISHQIKTHIIRLSQDIGWRGIEQYENLENTAQYITQYLERLGYQVEWQRMIAQGKTVKNIIAQKKGAKYPEKIIVVGAHYDSYFSPGADSNASGVAALLELAKILSKEATNATIHFVAFTSKEAPFFGTEDMGSAHYIKQAKYMGLKISSVIILDSLGYYSNDKNSQRYPPLFGFFLPNKGNFISIVGNLNSLNLLKVVEPIMKKNLSLPVQAIVGFDFINSDHWVFWKGKCETILVTDTGSYRNPHVNSLTDTYQALNVVNIAQVVRGLAATIRTLSY